MTIRFSCPRCKAVLGAPDDKAGKLVACPKCQQHLQVPDAGLSTAIVSAPVAANPPPLAQGVSPVPKKPPDVDQNHGKRKQKKSGAYILGAALRKPRAKLIVGAGAGVVLLFFIMVGFAMVSRPTLGRGEGQRPETRPIGPQGAETRSEDEELVKKYILNNAKHPKNIDRRPATRMGIFGKSSGTLFFLHSPMTAEPLCHEKFNPNAPWTPRRSVRFGANWLLFD